MKKIIAQFDIFSALPTLRAQGQGEVVNVCGGLLSIIIFGLFTYIFISNMVQTVQLQNITSTQTIQSGGSDTPKASNMTIGFGLQQKNFLQLRNIFQLQVFVSDTHFNMVQLQTFPCTREMWAQFDEKKYNSMRLDTHLCIQRQGVQISGQSGQLGQVTMYLKLRQCNNATSPIVCASTADINNYFAANMSFGRFMAASLVILDTGINANSEIPNTFSAYQKTLWLLFNQQQQIIGQVFIGSYQINTDTNFLPFQTKLTQTGYYVSQAIMTSMINNVNSTTYLQVFLMASPIHKVVDRVYGKLDDVLSYVGGLYGIVISFFAFFLLSFNQYKYQLRVSEGAFSFQNGHLARQQNLHFGKYLKYVLFDWIKTFTCHEVDWEDCKAIDEAREEANEQIDVKHLLKRISHLEKMIGVLVNTEDELVMQIAESYSIQQAKHRRNISEYCEKFKDSKRSLTILTIQNIDTIFQYNYQTSLKTSVIHPVDNNFENSFVEMSMKNTGAKSIEMQQIQNRHKKQGSQSLMIMDEYLRKYEHKFNISQQKFDDLTQQDLKVEQQIAQAFYKLQDKTRLKIIRKIPLSILYRFNQWQKKHERELSQNNNKPSTGKDNQLYSHNSFTDLDKTIQFKK